ncbi:Tim17/Tim22/Tim23/Pmp24 family-domain-containing protein [Chaetomidium leptoderma]|uniref:Mitochondrial import inner membrane translocase subunit TIM22 n=1 Tax=Chaetomidium leptoderma TaxID=669021 RepID=A0AAN6ZYG9_9PEZI|nr:Tim17/Tim22/Tim23/Pmp24 family-domain-containing protein [Chaetomidium leptoderma]
MNFPGSGGGLGGLGGGVPGIPSAGGAGGGAAPGFDPNDANVKFLTNAMESCYAKTVMSGGAGFALGGLFGVFMASMAYDTPFHTAGAPGGAGGMPGIPGSAAATATPISSLPLRRQLAHGFKDMGARSWSTAKNFGAVGALFSGIECGIEGLRAKNDLGNGVAAGCLTGAILARNGGPQAAAIGCAGFAAFSAAIDAWMRMPKDED